MPIHRSARNAGAYAARVGQDFEDECSRLHDRLAPLVKIVKAPQEVFPQKTSIGLIWRPKGKGPYDWFGAASGAPVYFETKRFQSRNKNGFPKKHTLDKRYEHQLVALRDMQQALGSIGRYFVLADWHWIKEDGSVQTEYRLHPISCIDGRTLTRDLSILSPERNWFEALFSDEYNLLSKVGLASQYQEEGDIPL